MTLLPFLRNAQASETSAPFPRFLSSAEKPLMELVQHILPTCRDYAIITHFIDRESRQWGDMVTHATCIFSAERACFLQQKKLFQNRAASRPDE